MASSMLTVASPSSISLWARPEGIIGKQFSLGSTTQSKITGRAHNEMLLGDATVSVEDAISEEGKVMV